MTGFVLFWLLIVGIIYSLKSFEDFKECRQESENCGDVCECEKNDLLCAYGCLQCVDKKQLDCCIYLFKDVCNDVKTIRLAFLLRDHEKNNSQITRYEKLKS